MSGNNKVAKKSSKKKIDHDNVIIDLKKQIREEIARGDKANLISFVRNEMMVYQEMNIITLCSR